MSAKEGNMLYIRVTFVELYSKEKILFKYNVYNDLAKKLQKFEKIFFISNNTDLIPVNRKKNCLAPENS